jgi:hypothetical protein
MPSRVCRAWHRANGVQVPVPGVRGAEGEEQDTGVTVRGRLQAGPSLWAGRRPGTGDEGWHTGDERARDREVLPPQQGVPMSIIKLLPMSPDRTHDTRCSPNMGS